MDASVKPYCQVATLLGLRRATVTDAVRCLRLRPKPVPHNGKAKGLDDSDIAAIRQALRIPDHSQVS